ncbi:MAG TPA: POTRA domain-containing protein [Kofleriaceae bacterium]|jgi:outer membrane protein assembly factor BamA
MKKLLAIASLAVIGGFVAVKALPTDGDALADRVIPRNGAIASISLDGHEDNVPVAALRTDLSTKLGETVDAQKLVTDRQAMLADLVGRGFLSATVSPAQVMFASDGAAYIVFDVSLGQQYRVRSVTVTGATEKDAVITISSGDDAIASRIESARNILAENLARHGKPHDVTLTTTVDHAAAVVDVALVTH